MFVHVCLSGLQNSLYATRAIDVFKDSHDRYGILQEFSSEEYYKKAKKQAEEEEAFGREQESKGFTYLYALASIKLWSILEAMVDDLALDGVQHPDRCGDPKLLTSLKGPLLEFLKSSDDERAEFLVGQLKQTLRASTHKGIGRFETILSAVGLDGGVPEEVRRAILELAEVRNVIVHRRGIADGRFVSSCPWYGVGPGEELLVTDKHYRAYELGILLYSLEIDLRLRHRDSFHPEMSSKVVELKGELLDDLRKINISGGEALPTD
jgi:uncharacterized protein YutE (UPF0331/DUF86 family)